LLPKNIISKIEKVKKDLIDNNVFGNPLSNIQFAACIYYVTSVPISKGGILQTRLQITDPVTNKQVKITTELLGSKCGKFAAATLSKNINIIINFYNSNKSLLNE
jgi:hypothetical protein